MELGCRANCAQYFHGKPPPQAGLQPVMCEELWSRVAIDITGRYPKSRNVYEYILTVMNYFTKWAEAYPIRDHKATTVASSFTELVYTPRDAGGDHKRAMDLARGITVHRTVQILQHHQIHD